MKKLFTSFLLGSGLMTMAAQADDYVRVPVKAAHVFAPFGFDSNDDTVVVVSGWVPNLCYKDFKPQVEMSGGAAKVVMTAMKDMRLGRACAQVAIPFLEPVSLGNLKKGDYPVVVNAGVGNELEDLVSVSQASSPAVDDHAYLMVDRVAMTPGSNIVEIDGFLPSSCMQFDRIETYSNGKNAYSVLPILKKVADFCPMKLVPYSIQYEVPQTLAVNSVLLHVRSMSGKFENAVFERPSSTAPRR
jgi:hypothetical protein